ncbi:MCP four helix bundle domain-containing protein [Leptospira sp. 96542]|nr:MCP four helix bundle domain-containing protein [Leptospira sp. 96542]
MNYLNNLKISTRLWLLIALLSSLLAFIGFLGLNAANQANEGLRSTFEERTVPLSELGNINYLLNRNRILIMDMLIHSDPANVQRRSKEFRENSEKRAMLWKQYAARKLRPEEAKIAKVFDEQVADYASNGMTPVVDALLAGNREQAEKFYREALSPKAPAVQDSTTALFNLQIEVAQQEYGLAVERYKTQRMISISVIVLGIVLSVVFGYFLIRNIALALGHAIEVSLAVSEGNLSNTIRQDGQDEVAQVLKSLAAMQRNLALIVTNVREGSEGVSTASAEIAQGNQDLSARTESQASAPKI